MSYSDKLRDPRWQKKRLEILQRDGFVCQSCNDDKTELHIHHDYYQFNLNPWEYPSESLHTYCRHCHSAFEYLKKEFTSISIRFVKKIYGTKYPENVFITIIFNATDLEQTIIFYFMYDGTAQELFFPVILTETMLVDINNTLAEFKSKL